MSWLSQLRPGSFRGIPFHSLTHRVSGGRRGVHHEFPGSDQGEIETFGLADKKFTFDLVLFGDDMRLRNAMWAALDAAGAGELIHPFVGTVLVEVDPEERWTLAESAGEGRKSVFTVTFVKSAPIVRPTVRTDTRRTVLISSEEARQAALDLFQERYAARGRPGFVAAASEGLVGSLLTQIEGAMSSLRLVTSEINASKSQVIGTRKRVSTLVYEPTALGAALQGALTLGGAALSNPLGTLGALGLILDGWRATLRPVPNSNGAMATASRRAEADNQTALEGLVTTTAAALKADALVTADFDSYEEATAALADALDLIDEAAAAASDPVFAALEDLRAKLVTDTRQRSIDLARLVRVSINRTRPALAVAYDLFEDLDKADDLISRNALKHPNFVPAGRPLEVLSNV
ncbi:DNA circularization protein [Sneathiella sp.]|uniref:DNA circularization protein n=1 Tax=Sneathiella sp. TaxID=1964365 RepID=UPI002FE35ED9